MQLNEITQQAGAHRKRKRIGRGESSGHGKTSGRGHKGSQSRSGAGLHPLYEGGQMPLFRRLPKRGFNNFNFRTDYQVVNLLDLDKRFDDGATVDLDALKAARLVNGRQPLVKVLNKGQLTKKLTVHAHAFSGKAKAAIEQAGGAANLIERVKPAEAWAAKRRTVASNKIGKQSASKASSETASSETPPAEDATE